MYVITVHENYKVTFYLLNYLLNTYLYLPQEWTIWNTAFYGTTIPRNNPKYPENNPEITEAIVTAARLGS